MLEGAKNKTNTAGKGLYHLIRCVFLLPGKKEKMPSKKNNSTVKAGGKKQGGVKHHLTLKNKEFCKLYATNEDFFGNGTQAYIEAYKLKPEQYNSAGSSAKNLLIKPHILAYINEIMTETGFNEAHADKQLSFLMTQNAEMGVKLGAIKEFNALRQRILKKIELSGSVNLMSDDEAKAIRGKLKERYSK